MTYYTHTKDPIGCFTEKDVGNYFEYSNNPDRKEGCEDWCCFPHLVWVVTLLVVVGVYRYATVKKTVAYIVVNEDEYLPVIEKSYQKKY